MSIAIVTGASSGLGRAFARRLSREPDIQEIWAIARREERLKELDALCACSVRPIPLDLREDESFQALRVLLKQENPDISVLVCAAGFGKMGNAVSIDPSDNAAMIDVNCKAAMAVTLLCRPWLRRGSQVLEISSVSAFTPVPGVGVYAATKAYVLSYSLALGKELKDRGVTVTAICPGPVTDTEFFGIAEEKQSIADYKKAFVVGQERVVRQAIEDAFAGKTVSVCGLPMKAFRAMTKVLPWDLILNYYN